MHVMPSHTIAVLMLRMPVLRAAVTLQPYAQCGGITNAPSDAEAQDAAWGSASCPSGYTCISNNNPWFWQARTPRSWPEGCALCRRPTGFSRTLAASDGDACHLSLGAMDHKAWAASHERMQQTLW